MPSHGRKIIAVTLVQLAAGVIIAAELTGAGPTALSQPAPPGHSLPSWLIAVAWIPFTLGLAWTFNARMRDVPCMLLLVYLAWGVQELVLAHSLVNPQEGETGATAAVFVAATVLAFAAGVLEQFRNLPPRGVTILAGFSLSPSARSRCGGSPPWPATPALRAPTTSGTRRKRPSR